MRSLLLRRSAVMLSAFVLVGGAAAVVTPNAFGAMAPKITWTSGPTVTDSSVSIGYNINRRAKAVNNTLSSCTLNNGTTSTEVDCGSLTSDGKANPATYSFTRSGLADGTYTFSVNLVLSDGGKASATSPSFQIATTPPPPPCWDSGTFVVSDGRLTGAINTFHNFTRYTSTDGTCSGGSAPFNTIVEATDQAGATAVCRPIITAALGNYAGTPSRVNDAYPAAPESYWFCA